MQTIIKQKYNIKFYASLQKSRNETIKKFKDAFEDNNLVTWATLHSYTYMHYVTFWLTFRGTEESTGRTFPATIETV